MNTSYVLVRIITSLFDYISSNMWMNESLRTISWFVEKESKLDNSKLQLGQTLASHTVHYIVLYLDIINIIC